MVAWLAWAGHNKLAPLNFSILASGGSLWSELLQNVRFVFESSRRAWELALCLLRSQLLLCGVAMLLVGSGSSP